MASSDGAGGGGAPALSMWDLETTYKHMHLDSATALVDTILDHLGIIDADLLEDVLKRIPVESIEAEVQAESMARLRNLPSHGLSWGWRTGSRFADDPIVENLFRHDFHSADAAAFSLFAPLIVNLIALSGLGTCPGADVVTSSASCGSSCMACWGVRAGAVSVVLLFVGVELVRNAYDAADRSVVHNHNMRHLLRGVCGVLVAVMLQTSVMVSSHHTFSLVTLMSSIIVCTGWLRLRYEVALWSVVVIIVGFYSLVLAAGLWENSLLSANLFAIGAIGLVNNDANETGARQQFVDGCHVRYRFAKLQLIQGALHELGKETCIIEDDQWLQEEHEQHAGPRVLKKNASYKRRHGATIAKAGRAIIAAQKFNDLKNAQNNNDEDNNYAKLRKFTSGSHHREEPESAAAAADDARMRHDMGLVMSRSSVGRSMRQPTYNAALVEIEADQLGIVNSVPVSPRWSASPSKKKANNNNDTTFGTGATGGGGGAVFDEQDHPQAAEGALTREDSRVNRHGFQKKFDVGGSCLNFFPRQFPDEELEHLWLEKWYKGVSPRMFLCLACMFLFNTLALVYELVFEGGAGWAVSYLIITVIMVCIYRSKLFRDDESNHPFVIVPAYIITGIVHILSSGLVGDMAYSRKPSETVYNVLIMIFFFSSVCQVRLCHALPSNLSFVGLYLLAMSMWEYWQERNCKGATPPLNSRTGKPYNCAKEGNMPGVFFESANAALFVAIFCFVANATLLASRSEKRSRRAFFSAHMDHLELGIIVDDATDKGNKLCNIRTSSAGVGSRV